MKSRMQNSYAMLKQEFLERWMKGLHIYGNLNKDMMTISERKKGIKLSSDVAIASTRNSATHWSRAVMNDIVLKDANNTILVERILGRKLLKKPSMGMMITSSNKILRKSRIPRRRVVPKASCIAKKLVRNRTGMLKRIVPGGKELDEVSLIKETLDYIISLRAQVDVMRCVATTAESMDPSTTPLYL